MLINQAIQQLYFRTYFALLRATEHRRSDFLIKELCEKELVVAGDIFLVHKNVHITALVIHRLRMAAQYALNGRLFSCRLGYSTAEVLIHIRQSVPKEEQYLPEWNRVCSDAGIRRLDPRYQNFIRKPLPGKARHQESEHKVKTPKLIPISVFIRPCFEEDKNVTPQDSGPDENTQFWSVYVREATGECCCLDDYPTEEAARKYALDLSARETLPIEPYPWSK